MLKKYEIVVEGLSQLIEQKSPGDRLPTEQTLIEQYGVSAMTVRRALQYLLDGGRIETIPGKGTFVARHRVLKAMTTQSFTQTMRAQGRVPSSRLISAGLGVADNAERETLEMGEGAQVYRIRRLRLGDGVPLCVEAAIFAAQPFPGLLGIDLTGSIYETFQARFNTSITRASFRLRARHAKGDDAKLLNVNEHTACLEARTLGKTQHGALVESTTSLYRGDLFELSVDYV